MDELDLLKRNWNKKRENEPILSYAEIYKLIKSKSSNIVKWIYYISLFELFLGFALIIINPKIETKFTYPLWLDASLYFTIPVILFFIFRFYKCYKTIKATDTVKNLIKTILNTRQIVRYYILFNLVYVGIYSSFAIFYAYVETSGGLKKFNELAHFKEYLILFLIIIVFSTIMIGIVYFIYFLLYGILLKKLQKNYNELKKLEI